jgi:cytochrome P450
MIHLSTGSFLRSASSCRLLRATAASASVAATRGVVGGFSTAAPISNPTTVTSPTPPPAKPLPMPPGRYPIVGHLPRFYKKESVELWETFHRETGEIFELDVGFGNALVVTQNPHHAQLILAHQGRESIRTPMTSWDAVHKEKNWPPGIPWITGEDHRRNRQVLGETLLMHKNAKQYVPLVLPSANRYVDCLTQHLKGQRLPDDVPLTVLTGMFALEAVMKVVLGVDFKALTYPLNTSATDFAKSVMEMFTETAKIETGAPHLHIRFKTGAYKRLTKAWETMVRYPSETLAPVLNYYQQHGTLPPEADGTVLTKLIQQHEAGGLSLEEVKHVGVQAIAAAVDTTAQTTEYLFYNLACNPDVQEHLYRLVVDTTGPYSQDPDMHLTIEQYETHKYLNAVLKESMRYTPTIGVHARTLTQDADLGDGYVIPKGRLVLVNFMAMAQDPALYPSPELFMPERFVKSSPSAKAKEASSPSAGSCPFHRPADKAAAVERGDAVHNSPYAAIPFGHGARKCAGKAFAEMDIHLATMAVLRKYRIEYDGPPLQQREESLLRPSQPLNPHFKFVPRDE